LIEKLEEIYKFFNNYIIIEFAYNLVKILLIKIDCVSLHADRKIRAFFIITQWVREAFFGRFTFCTFLHLGSADCTFCYSWWTFKITPLSLRHCCQQHTRVFSFSCVRSCGRGTFFPQSLPGIFFSRSRYLCAMNLLTLRSCSPSKLWDNYFVVLLLQEAGDVFVFAG
jgi:hypothetical protein